MSVYQPLPSEPGSLPTSTVPVVAPTRGFASLGRSWQTGECGSVWLLNALPLLLVVCSSLLWWLSLPHVNLRAISDYGLVSVLPWTFFAALAVLTVSFCFLVHQRQARTIMLLLHIVVLVGIIHGTPAILYEAPRYGWVYKHIGVVDYIQRQGTLNVNLPDGVDPNFYIYFSWPGFFAISAFLADLVGLKSSISFAAWAPPVFNLLYVGALALIFKAFTGDKRLVWLSVWFFSLTNWIGQDYFAPQALSYLLHLAVIGMCLSWFQVDLVPSIATIRQKLIFDRPTSWLFWIIRRRPSDHQQEWNLTPFQRTAFMAVVLLLYGVVVASHQLTPFMTLVSVAALVLFQRCNARSLPLLMGVILTLWILYVAAAYTEDRLKWIVDSLFQLNTNLSDNVRTDLSKVTPGRAFVAASSRVLTLSVWLMAVFGCVRRLRQGYWDLSGVLLALAPFPLILVQSYGGEMLFRIYFFSLPFMVLFVGALFYPNNPSGRSARTLIMTITASAALLTGMLFAYYGNEKMNVFSKHEVDAMQYLYRNAPPNALIVQGAGNGPARFEQYENYAYYSLADAEALKGQSIDAEDVRQIEELMSNNRYSTAYLIVTRSQKQYVSLLSLLPEGTLDSLERAVAQSDQFEQVYQNADATIFTLAAK